MTTIMESTTLNNSNKTLTTDLNIEQLIESALSTGGNFFRDELIKAGKDNVLARILIKKSCKSLLASIEASLVQLNNSTSNELAKSLKNKFLNLISILDKLQLEWQKYDLGLTS